MKDVTIARWVATIAGLIGFVLSVATPLLPVTQTTATLNWPQSGQLEQRHGTADLAVAGEP